MKSKKIFAIGAVALSLLLGACSSSSDKASESTATEEAATQAILDLAAGKIRENALTAWITEKAKTKRRR